MGQNHTLLLYNVLTTPSSAIAIQESVGMGGAEVEPLAGGTAPISPYLNRLNGCYVDRRAAGLTKQLTAASQHRRPLEALDKG